MDVAAFYCQQGVEKALKALYVMKFKKLVRVRDLVYLSKRLGLPKDLLEICDEINPFYVEARYPNVHEEYEKDEVSDALEKAKKVLKWIEKRI